MVGSTGEAILLPESVYAALKDVVRNLSAGRQITVVARKRHLTTQAAANFLGFSRPHLIKLLEAGEIPFQRVGRHRRLRLKDVKAYQKKRDAARHAALNELARAEFAEGLDDGIPLQPSESDV